MSFFDDLDNLECLSDLSSMSPSPTRSLAELFPRMSTASPAPSTQRSTTLAATVEVPDSPTRTTSQASQSPSQRPARVNPGVMWCFTLNNWEELGQAWEDLKTFLLTSTSISKVVMQTEVGESGTPHIQGVIRFAGRVRPLSALKQFPAAARAHWEKTRNWKASVQYCSAIDKRAEGGELWTRGEVVPKPIKVIEVLRPWQQLVVDIINEEPDDRKVYWFWEPEGGVGKSALTKYLVVRHDALILSGKGADVKHGVVSYKERNNMYPRTVIYDVPRTSLDYVVYSALEEVKNACFFSGKFESNMCVGNCPHLIVFANAPPDMSKLSMDRWVITKIE